MKTIVLLKMLLLTLVMASGQTTLQVENMNIGGPYAGVIDLPFNGVAFYGNNDQATGTVNLPTLPGRYKIEMRGASSNSSEAKINLTVGGSNIGAFGFSGTSASISSREVTIEGNGALSVILELQTDNGSNDTFVDQVIFTYQGVPPPPRAAPVIPASPSFQSGVYRNMFVESGKSASSVQQKMNSIWDQYFVNGDLNNERLYYEVGSNMAYILDTGNNDVRSEGMSYGMMICVQLGKRAQFDKLWRFAKTYSQHPAGTEREGLFSWQLSRSNFSMIDQNSAPDGEEYFVTALFFADALWGSGGAINYRSEADYILDSMINKPEPSTGSCPTGLVDKDEKQIVFGICGNSASFTDPSYHLPAFYEIWAREAASNNQLWADMAVRSRTYLLPRAAHPVTGLMPDYSEFDGTPVNQGNHGNFEFDAWRNIMNMGFDFAWFQKNKNSIQPLIDRQIDFFKDKPGYSTLWTLDGSFSRNNDHSPGLVACNAVGALALEDEKVWPFVDEFFDTPIPSGQFRYYDGLLYMMSYMHLSGNFKALTDSTDIPDCNGTPFPTAAVSVVDETTQGADDGQIRFTFSDVSGRSSIEFSRDGGATYPLSINDNAGSATFNNVPPGSYNVWVRWGNNDCPIDLGNVTVQTGSGSGGCNGSDAPLATVSSTDETTQGANDGKITFTFSDNSGRSNIEFSRNGGVSYPLNVNDNSGSATFDNVPPGSYNVWVRWGNDDCPVDLGNVNVGAGNPIDPGQSAFVNHSIPGIIQAENYDNGGQGIAYNDTGAGNNGGQGRTNQGVDIQNTSDTGGGTNVGWIANGEWLEYTIGNVASGNYDIELRVAANNGNAKSVNVTLGSQDLGSVSIGNTGGWQNWTTLTINDVDLSGGTDRVLRLNFAGGSFNVNWIRFSENATNPPTGDDSYVIRAKGTSGIEEIRLTVNGTFVKSFTLSNSFQTYTASSNADGNARIEFINDAGGRDVQIDYLDKNGTRFQSEDQANNTGVWQNSSCGGSNSEMLHCNGYIEYSGSFNKEKPIENKNSFTLFPNPSNGTVHIVLDDIAITKYLRVYDLSGRVFKNVTKFSNKQFTFTGMHKGVYLIEMVTVGRKVVKKLVIQ